MESVRFHTGSRRMLSFALMGIMIGSVLGGILWNFGGVYFPKGLELLTFKSEQELVDFLKTRIQDAPKSLIDRFFLNTQQSQVVVPKSIFGANSGDLLSNAYSALAEDVGGSVVTDYSTTNIQVAGVDEADIVKTDGEYLYLASGSKVYIIRAYPVEDAEVLSEISLNTTTSGLYVNDGKLVIFQNGYDSKPVYTAVIPNYGAYVYRSTNTSVMVYDVSNRSEPELKRLVTVDGSYFSSRMIGDYVYAVINKPAYAIDNNTASLPVIRLNNSSIRVSASSVAYTGLQDYAYSFTVIVAINIEDTAQKPTIEPFLLGATSQIYVSMENVYLTSTIYNSQYRYTTIGTTIHKISVEGGSIIHVASGNVSGYVLNQFSMDEYNGLFRVTTSNWTATSVYCLDENLKTVGRLEGLARGENLHSARFMGNRCYLVTFKKVDPLFVIGLEDPENPKVLGQLKIPGYSDYLHPYDETHVIGVGKETVEAEGGSFAWYQGVKIALFDVSNVSQPREIDKYVIGDRGTDSTVLSNHKAFLFSKSKQLLALPILLAKIDPTKYPQGVPAYTYGEYVWQGAYIFNVTLGGFALKGGITHFGNGIDLQKGYYFNSPYFVKRVLYIGDALYTISDRMVKMNSLEDLTELGIVELH